jgi:hypothetical protein
MSRITELFQQFGIPFKKEGEHEHARSGWTQVDCPYCSPHNGHFRLGFSLRHRGARCWKCGPVPAARAFAELARVPYGRARELLGGLTPEGYAPKARGTLRRPPGTGPLKAAHELYLEGRGFDPGRLTRLWGVLGIGQQPHARAWSLYVPVTFGGREVSFTTRTVRAGAATGAGRYNSAKPEEEEIPHRSLLYGEDEVPGSSVIVVEGVADVWAIGPGAVATFGTAVTPAQVGRIVRFPRRAVLFDSEPDAQRAADRLCELLAIFPGRTERLQLRSGKDAADAGEGSIAYLRTKYLEGD